jgi:hypothetical protein
MNPLVKIAALVSLLTLGAAPAPARAPRFERVLQLEPAEGVFAYARISPDGRYLVYASEVDRERTVTLVDLKTKKRLFTEPGIDPYFSTDGARFIYLSAERDGVAMYHMGTGTITPDVAPVSLGDYFSWGWRDGKNLILTIQSNYYYLDGDIGVMPASRVAACPDIGVGDRPLLSRDGKRITTFVRGTIVVRNLTDCDYTLDTGIPGAKADFSWDGRHIAFHAPKATGRGYEIQVVDIEKKTVRTVTNLPGSSYFPSWTKDGRLNFRYDGDDYRGFMMASDVLSAPARPLPQAPPRTPANRRWSDIFPETPQPTKTLSLVTVWGSWSAHSPDALIDLQRARDHFARTASDVSVATATDPGSFEPDIARLVGTHGIQLPRIPLAAERLTLTEAQNQIPTTLLFRDGQLVDRRLGAQTYDQLRAWVETARTEHPRSP